MILKDRTCVWCHEDFTPKQKNAITCCSKCSSSYSSWKSRTIKKYGILLKRDEVSKRQFNEIQAFLYEMKTKCFIADIVDIYRLIHYYDMAYPHLENLPKPSDPSKSIPLMFYKLAIWWKSKKKKMK